MTIVAVINRKGGVGKTTTAAHLAHGLALRGDVVTAIDLDPADQLAGALGHADPSKAGTWSVLEQVATFPAVSRAARERLAVVSAGARLAELETAPRAGAEAGFRVRRALNAVDSDHVILDCPPSGSLLAMNGLIAADVLLVPVAADPLALDATLRMLAVIEHVCARLRLRPAVDLLLTRFHRRRRVAAAVRETLAERHGASLLPVAIHEGAAIAEAGGRGRTVFETRSTSRAAADHEALIDAFLARHGKSPDGASRAAVSREVEA